MNRLLGYARVSTNGQELTGQLDELRAASCERIYQEKASGARTDRPELAKLLRALEMGDVVVVVALDRLARSTRDLLNILAQISGNGAKFKSLRDPWADTTTAHGELMVTILAGLATFERHLIRLRTGEGRKRARERGVKFGRPPKLNHYQRQEALRRIAAGESQADMARLFGVDPSVICRMRKPVAQEERERCRLLALGHAAKVSLK
jgi:DNA invertase Pin-like site-specific DNA recombinase